MGWQPETQPKGKLPIEKTKGAETMQSFIEADALIELLARMQSVCHTHAELIYLSKVLNQVKRMPTIDAVPERTGTWTEEYDTNDDPLFRRKFRCSACHGWNTYGFTRYCPECGAKMLNASALTQENK